MSNGNDNYAFYQDKYIIDSFLSKYENIKSRNRYEATVKEFIDLINYRGINQLTKDELRGYYDVAKDNANKVSHIREFYKYLIGNNHLNKSITEDGKFVEWVYNFRAEKGNKGKLAIKFPLNTIIEIDYDIKNNYTNPPKENIWDYERTLKIAFIWEMLFDAGVEVGNLKLFKARYISNKQSYVESGKKNPIVEAYYSDDDNIIKSIINKYYNSLLRELSEKDYDGFTGLTHIETYFNDDLEVYGLLPQDIQESRKKFYIRCHNCGTEHKITSENWVIVQHEKSLGKYIVCNTCRGSSIYGK